MAAEGDGLFHLLPVVALATFDFGKFANQLPVAAVEESGHRISLGIHAEAVDALLGGADPVIADEFSCHHTQYTQLDGYCQSLKRPFESLTDPQFLHFAGWKVVGLTGIRRQTTPPHKPRTSDTEGERDERKGIGDNDHE